VARQTEVNHIDETFIQQKGVLQWLWVMTNVTVAFFMIHPHRSKEAFEALIGDWVGFLVSDGMVPTVSGLGFGRRVLPLIRKARELSERKILRSHGSEHGSGELQRLCHMARAQPTVGEWRTFYARLIRLITLNRDRQDEAGGFPQAAQGNRLLVAFPGSRGVSPTNNHAERMLRFAVMWRNRSHGVASERVAVG